MRNTSMSEKTIAIGIALTVLAGAFLTCTAIPSVDAGTTERDMWPLNANITVDVTPSGGVSKYVQIEEGEILTVNWLAVNMTGQGAMYVTVYPSIPPLNWTNITQVGTTTYYQTIWTYHDTPPQSLWIRSGGRDVMKVNIQAVIYSGTWTPITINMTVTRDSYTAPGINGLEDKIDALQKQLDALDINALRASIRDLQIAQSGLNTQMVSLRDAIAMLQVALDQNGQNDTTLRSQITTLSETLKTLESLSAQNNETLTAEYTLLTEKIASINNTATNTTTIINNTEVVENPYNDTALWGEVNTIKATPPVTQYNNTTQVHPTTYTTKTLSHKEEANIIPAIVAGIMSGVLTALIIGVIIYVWVRRRYGGAVKAPETI
jgi:hypothetical protein